MDKEEDYVHDVVDHIVKIIEDYVATKGVSVVFEQEDLEEQDNQDAQILLYVRVMKETY